MVCKIYIHNSNSLCFREAAEWEKRLWLQSWMRISAKVGRHVSRLRLVFTTHDPTGQSRTAGQATATQKEEKQFLKDTAITCGHFDPDWRITTFGRARVWKALAINSESCWATTSCVWKMLRTRMEGRRLELLWAPVLLLAFRITAYRNHQPAWQEPGIIQSRLPFTPHALHLDHVNVLPTERYFRSTWKKRQVEKK